VYKSGRLRTLFFDDSFIPLLDSAYAEVRTVHRIKSCSEPQTPTAYSVIHQFNSSCELYEHSIGLRHALIHHYEYQQSTIKTASGYLQASDYSTTHTDPCENTNTEVDKVTIEGTPTIIYVETTQQPRDIFKVFSKSTTVFNTSGQMLL
jgi:hypothetical protein